MKSRLMQQIKKLNLKQVEVSQKTGIKYKTVNRQCIQGIKTVRVAGASASGLPESGGCRACGTPLRQSEL